MKKMKAAEKQNHKPDVIIIGGGAAGLMAALTAGKRGLQALILEHNERLGKKILISGGGRCNFTHLNTTGANFLSKNPKYALSALSQYTPKDFLALIEKNGIAWQEKSPGQLFCRHSAKDILKMFENEFAQLNLTIRCGVQVKQIEKTGDGLFLLQTSIGTLITPSLIIATGGLSYSRLGATGFGYDVARQFQLPIIKQQPALTPLLWNPTDARTFSGLSGLSAIAKVKLGSLEFEDGILFTHKGLSGPSILQISSYWKPGESIVINWLPKKNLREVLATRKQLGDKHLLRNALADFFPERLTEVFAGTAGEKPINEISDKQLFHVADSLNAFRFTPSQLAGYELAEVTSGGIDTRYLNSKTMGARDIPGLYFIGEVVDVTGWLGGYNFQWAWASGASAGKAVLG